MKFPSLLVLLLCACQTTPHATLPSDLHWLTQEALQLEANVDWQNVKELRFSSTPTDAHLRSLQALPALTSLHIWDEGCFQAPEYPTGRMDDATLKLIAELAQLESLSIAGWNVFYSDAGLRNIAKMPRLKQLKVSMAPNVSDEGMRILAQMQPLTHLDITYTTITDVGLGYLLEAPHLEHVAYGWTQTQELHAQRFLEAHPQATFLVGFQTP